RRDPRWGRAPREVCDGPALSCADPHPPSGVVRGAEGGPREPAAPGKGERGRLAPAWCCGVAPEIACPSTHIARLSKHPRRYIQPASNPHRTCNEGASKISDSEGPSQTVDDNE